MRSFSEINEPQHDKTKKVAVHPVKTQISLGISPVWSESLLCSQWVVKDPSFLPVDSEGSDQTGGMPMLIWVFAGHTLILLVLSCRGSFSEWNNCLQCWCNSNTLSTGSLVVGSPALSTGSCPTLFSNLSLIPRKPVFGIFDQARHTLTCSATEASQSLQTLDIGSIGIRLSK